MTIGLPVRSSSEKSVISCLDDTAGDGLSLTASAMSATWGPTDPDSGTALTVPRSDHIHDGRYFTEGELSATSGTINSIEMLPSSTSTRLTSAGLIAEQTNRAGS